MSTSSDPQWPQPGKDATRDELEVDIKHTREQLGETIDALSQKFDLKAQARHTLQDANRRAGIQLQTARGRAEHVLAQAKDAVTDAHGALKPVVAVGAAVATATLATVVVLVVWSRRRSATPAPSLRILASGPTPDRPVSPTGPAARCGSFCMTTAPILPPR